MGLWNFVKNAGKSLIGSAEASEAQPEETLKAEVEKLGLDTAGLDITVADGKVKVSGGTMSTEEKEKIVLAVGNVEGISSVEADLDEESVFHTVEKGDTLWAVATKTLGDGNRYKEIFEANQPMLSHPDKIYPGQVLRVPSGKSA